MSLRSQPIKIKFLTKSRPGMDEGIWLRRFPGFIPRHGNCEFIFDRDQREYDWLVVYDDLPSVRGERATLWEEVLACPREQTLLITSEPSTIKVYGAGFLRQFGYVLTSQEPKFIQHPKPIFSQCGLIWFYGGETDKTSYDYIANHCPVDKRATIATVCSSKQQKYTLHRDRYQFTQELKAQMPELDIFGHGVRFIQDKAEALDPYRYHLSIENHVFDHHWTEKLSDCFLGLTLPFYHGCPNVFDYFPEESILPINIENFGESLERIQKAIQDREFEKRLPELKEARRLVLEEYSLFPLVSRLVDERTPIAATKTPAVNQSILSRHAWRKCSHLNLFKYSLEKAAVSIHHRIGIASGQKSNPRRITR